jgi:hypothetical protein
MGWKLSPPYFSAYTETATDLANTALANAVDLPPHPLESRSQLHTQLRITTTPRYDASRPNSATVC